MVRKVAVMEGSCANNARGQTLVNLVTQTKIDTLQKQYLNV